MRKRASLLAVLALMSIPVACATGGTASQTATTASASAPAGPMVAPRVQHPLDARGIAACDLLTPAQLVALGIGPGTGETSMQGTAERCRWRLTDVTGFLSVASALDLPVGGLEGLYLVRKTFAVFEPGELDGFPTVRANRNEDGDALCTLHTGVTDDQLIVVDVGLVNSDRSSCEIAAQAMSNVLSNLPPLA